MSLTIDSCIPDSQDDDSSAVELSPTRLRDALRIRRDYSRTNVHMTGSLDSAIARLIEWNEMDSGLFDSREPLDMGLNEQISVAESLQMMPVVTENQASSTNAAVTLLGQQQPASGDDMSAVGITSVSRYRERPKRDASARSMNIYTVDKVEYAFGCTREMALKYIERYPDLIEAQRSDKGLRKYMREKHGVEVFSGRNFDIFQDEEKDSSAHSSQLPHQTETQPSDKPFRIHQTENGAYSTDDDPDVLDLSSTDSSSEDEAVDADAIHIQFRGRLYTSMKKLVRHSGLPGSYFREQVPESPSATRPKVRKKPRYEEARPGLAKKKMRFATGEQTSRGATDSTFTTGEASQEKELTPASTFLDDTMGISDMEQEPDQSLFPDVKVRYYPSAPRTLAVLPDELYDSDIFEDGGFGGDLMLAQGDKKPRSSGIGKSAPRFDKKDRRTRKVTNRPRKSDFSERTSTSSKNRSGCRTKRRQLTLLETSRSKQSPGAQRNVPLTLENVLGYDDESVSRAASSLPTPPPSSVKSKKKKNVIKASKYFSFKPDNFVRGRSVHMSTVVYETLGEDYAVLPKKVAHSAIVDVDDYNPHADNNRDDHAMKTISRYKELYKRRAIDMDTELRVTFRGKTFLFSQLSDVDGTLREFLGIMQEFVEDTDEFTVMETAYGIISFCHSLDVTQAKSLITFVDELRLKFELNAKSRRLMRFTDIFCLCICYTLYYCSHSVLEKSYLKYFDFEGRTRSIVKLVFDSLASYGNTLSGKLRKYSFFSEGISLLFQHHQTSTWEVVANCLFEDLEFFRDLCAAHNPGTPLWKVVVQNIRNRYKAGDMDAARHSIMYMESFLELGWQVDIEIVLELYECIKRNKFDNFPGERPSVEVMSDSGIDRSTVINQYLNLLLEYGKNVQHNVPGRLLERLTPVSSMQSSSLTVLCNRLNILLCLSISTKRSFDVLFSKLVTSYERPGTAKGLILSALAREMNIDGSNKKATSLLFLSDFIQEFLNEKDFIPMWKMFIENIEVTGLHMSTQRELVAAIMQFASNDRFFEVNRQFIMKYAVFSAHAPSLELILNNLDSKLHRQIWLTLASMLVSTGTSDWTTLIQEHRLQDDAQVYSYALHHGGKSFYDKTREQVISCLINNLMRSNVSPMLNDLIKMVCLYDRKLISSVTLVESNQFSIAMSLTGNLLSQEEGSLKAKISAQISAVLLTQMKGNHAARYHLFVKRMLEFLRDMAMPFVDDLQSFKELCAMLGIGIRQRNPELMGSTHGSLQLLDKNLQESFHHRRKFSPSRESMEAVFLLLSLYLEQQSSWMAIARLIEAISIMIIPTVSTKECLKVLQVLDLILYSLKERPLSDSYKTQAMVYTFRVLINMTHYLCGTNDFKLIQRMSFKANQVIHGGNEVYSQIQYLHTPGMRSLIKTHQLTGSMSHEASMKLMAELEDLFNEFTTLVDGIGGYDTECASTDDYI